MALIKNESVIYAEDFKTVNELTFTRSDIIAALMAEKLDYDIEVSGALYQSTAHNRCFVKDEHIKDLDYKREYIYNRGGKVLKVIYYAKGGAI